MSESLKRGKSDDGVAEKHEVVRKMQKVDDKVASTSEIVAKKNDGNSSKDNDDDDDLFGELSGTVNRVVEKPSVLEIGVKYQVTEMYCVKVDGRTAIIGKLFREDTSASVYIWLSSSLTRNLGESDVVKLNAKLQQGKKAFTMYSGTVPNKYGQATYLMDWVKK